MRSFRKATLRDVARLAGVSPTTVSEYLSGQPNACSPGTGSRIQKAVEELHYAPSALGASLRKAATRAIGLSLLLPSASHIRRGNFLIRVWEGVTQAAFANEHSLLFYEDTIRRDLTNYRVFLDGRVDGVIFQPVAGDKRPVRLAEAGLPVAVLSAEENEYPGCITVMSDEAEIGGLVMNHLWEQGHRRIAHLAGPTHGEGEAGTYVAVSRCAAYREFCQQRGIFDPALLFEPTYWNPNQEEQTREWRAVLERWRTMPDPPTALFCVTDSIALGVLEYAAETNWHVPEELSVVGVDNTIGGELNHPALTTVEYPVEEQGRAACRALFQSIQGAPPASGTLVIGGAELILRETTAPPKRG